MRTTIQLRDALLRRAKKRAAEEGRTLASLIEEGVVLVLTRPPRQGRAAVSIPVSTAGGGLHPGVNLDRTSELEALMDAE
jgi:hypothetical protein